MNWISGLRKYSPDQPRQANGEFGDGDGAYPPKQEGEPTKAYLKRVVDKMPRPTTLPEKPDRYFNIDADTKMIATSDLVSSKSDEENKQGGENAPKRMIAAYRGIVPKRDPISVSERSDGKFTVVDGNGTFTTLKEYGWSKIPAKLATAKFAKYAPDQARDERGRFTADGDSGSKPSLDHLFSDSLGIKRSDMPQVPQRGGMQDKFVDELKAEGVSVEKQTVPARSLKATQSEYNASNVEFLRDKIAGGNFDPDNRIIVSSDNRVLDGHHRWAALAQDGKDINVIRVGLPIRALLTRASNFAATNGIAARTVQDADHQHAKFDLFDELEKLETYALAKGAQDGHPFYGNQYTDGAGAAASNEPAQYGNAQTFIEQHASTPLTSRMSIDNISKLATIYASSAAQKPVFDKSVTDIAKQVGGEALIPPLKGIDRASQKIESDYNGDAMRIKDVMRATVMVDSPDKANAVVDYFSKNYQTVGATRNLFDPNAKTQDGYRDAKMNVKVPNDHIAEVQVNVQEMLDAKAQAHGLYEQRSTIERAAGANPSAEDNAKIRSLNDQMTTIYDAAWNSFLSRSKASKSITVPLRDKLLKGNARGGWVSKALIREAPLGNISTYTGTPSTSQNSKPLSPGQAMNVLDEFEITFIKNLREKMRKLDRSRRS